MVEVDRFPVKYCALARRANAVVGIVKFAQLLVGRERFCLVWNARFVRVIDAGKFTV